MDVSVRLRGFNLSQQPACHLYRKTYCCDEFSISTNSNKKMHCSIEAAGASEPWRIQGEIPGAFIHGPGMMAACSNSDGGEWCISHPPISLSLCMEGVVRAGCSAGGLGVSLQILRGGNTCGARMHGRKLHMMRMLQHPPVQRFRGFTSCHPCTFRPHYIRSTPAARCRFLSISWKPPARHCPPHTLQQPHPANGDIQMLDFAAAGA